MWASGKSFCPLPWRLRVFICKMESLKLALKFLASPCEPSFSTLTDNNMLGTATGMRQASIFVSYYYHCHLCYYRIPNSENRCEAPIRKK